jgi:hypothetical protein
MSPFEFVLIPYAIILGLAITEVLAGWGKQIRHRHRFVPDSLQITSSGVILFLGLQMLWGFWIVRGVVWTYPLFLFLSLPCLAIALAAYTSRIDTSIGALPAREQYFQNNRPIYLLLATLPVVVITISFVPGLRSQLPDPPNHLMITLVRLLVLGTCISLALSKSARFHWLALGVFWLAALSLVTRLVAGLEPSVD